MNSRAGKKRLYLCVAVIVAGLLLSPLAFAVPVATTQVDKICSIQAGGEFIEDAEHPGVQPYEQDLSSNLIWSDGIVTASAGGSTIAGFGPGFPFNGNVNVSACISRVGGDYGTLNAALSGNVLYYFEIQPLPGTVVPPNLMLSVFFGARGEGHVSYDSKSLATAYGRATLSGAPLNTNDVWFEFSNDGYFDEMVSVNLYPSYVYSVGLGASSNVYGENAQSTAVVDPYLGFDQEAFDIRMGDATFPQSEYYKFVFSENLVVKVVEKKPMPWIPLLLLDD